MTSNGGAYRDSEKNRFGHNQVLANGSGPMNTAHHLGGGENQPLTATEYMDHIGPDNESAARVVMFGHMVWPAAPGGGLPAPRGWHPPMLKVAAAAKGK